MPVSMADVRQALDPDEVDYPSAAALGEEALPFLAELVAGDDPGMAAKAAYLAGLLNAGGSETVVAQAASHADARVRAAAASAAGHLDHRASGRVLTGLVADDDAGVQKLALKSVPARPSADLLDGLRTVSQNSEHASLRSAAEELLEGHGGG